LKGTQVSIFAVLPVFVLLEGALDAFLQVYESLPVLWEVSPNVAEFLEVLIAATPTRYSVEYIVEVDPVLRPKDTALGVPIYRGAFRGCLCPN
jgi:hypothetical protein